MQSGGGRYIVPTGRRDGTISLAKNVNLPSPSISVSNSIQAFAKKGLNATDMIYLLGNHTSTLIQFLHCSIVQYFLLYLQIPCRENLISPVQNLVDL